MTKSKAGADASAAEQPIVEAPVPVEIEEAHERPSVGGSYISNPDGSLTRVEED